MRRDNRVARRSSILEDDKNAQVSITPKADAIIDDATISPPDHITSTSIAEATAIPTIRTMSEP